LLILITAVKNPLYAYAITITQLSDFSIIVVLLQAEYVDVSPLLDVGPVLVNTNTKENQVIRTMLTTVASKFYGCFDCLGEYSCFIA
jgi:hypothetical protein